MTTTTFDWTSVAPSWSSHRAHVEQMKDGLTRELLESLDLQPGERVLELGAGTGDLARRLARPSARPGASWRPTSPRGWSSSCVRRRQACPMSR